MKCQRTEHKEGEKRRLKQTLHWALSLELVLANGQKNQIKFENEWTQTIHSIAISNCFLINSCLNHIMEIWIQMMATEIKGDFSSGVNIFNHHFFAAAAAAIVVVVACWALVFFSFRSKRFSIYHFQRHLTPHSTVHMKGSFSLSLFCLRSRLEIIHLSYMMCKL